MRRRPKTGPLPLPIGAPIPPAPNPPEWPPVAGEEKGPSRATPTVAFEAPPASPELSAVQKAPAIPKGLEGIFAAEAPGPTLSKLALALLASELIARRGVDLRSRSDRYCAYLLASFGGLRAELWVRNARDSGDTWVCFGTPDGTAGQFEACVQAGAGLRTHEALPARIVEIRPALQDPIGILVIVGRGAQKVDVSYAEAAARFAVGLAFGARAELVA